MLCIKIGLYVLFSMYAEIPSTGRFYNNRDLKNMLFLRKSISRND